MLFRFMERHPVLFTVASIVVLMGLGVVLGLYLPDPPPSRTERRLDAIERRLDALEASQKRPAVR